MRLIKSATAVVLAGVTAVSFAAPAVSAPLMTQGAISQSAVSHSGSAPVEQVQYYRRHHYHHGYHGGYRRGPSTGALVGGLAVGAIIGGAIAASQAQAAQQQQNQAYCAQRFRSYDPGSGTYLSKNGQRVACPSAIDVLMRSSRETSVSRLFLLSVATICAIRPTSASPARPWRRRIVRLPPRDR